ncbi:hypothetical protein ACFXJ5_14410 [Streptomyces sp. NPDC059373]
MEDHPHHRRPDENPRSCEEFRDRVISVIGTEVNLLKLAELQRHPDGNGGR